MKKMIVVVICSIFICLSVCLSYKIVLAGDDDEGGGPILFTKPVKAVLFDHKTHLGFGYSCEDCHDKLFEEAKGTAEEKGDFTMKSLYAGKYCGACHNGETAFASNTKCAVCHIGVKGMNRLTKTGKK
ncbi:MAG: cytochrome c3 family protein [Dissulfurimicrobium sp.]|uniref:cytochrome c3 family protein n=1 Tax=Dissulfurimicrobium TaxID=1769732 RepID=UPI001EDBDA4B|nr:cytochrome c3 family protein [Dissulfurimicrobium hydrothermale]UKL14427.1 cytochrome c3 family protein [Dissulfurimicrobium hydrothermale]